MNRNKIALLILFLILIAGCSSDKRREIRKPVISVSILPQKYFLEQLSDSFFRINVMVPPGASPATYALTPGQMKLLSESILYFQIGHIGFEEAWMDRIASTNKKMKICNTSEGIELISGEEEEHGNHVHPDGIDPHVWMSAIQAKKICQNMHGILVDMFPEQRKRFDVNLEKCMNEVDELHREIEKKLQPKHQKSFLIFHPALTYFARDYGLEQHSLELEGKDPTPQHMAKIIQSAQAEGINIVFIQKEFDMEQARTLANEIKGKVIPIDPLAYNWPDQLRDIADKLDKTLK